MMVLYQLKNSSFMQNGVVSDRSSGNSSHKAIDICAVPLKGVSGALGAEQNLTGGDSTSYLLNSSTPQDPRREGQFQQHSFSSKNWKCCVGGYQGQYFAPAFPCFKYYNSSSETFCKSQNMWISSKKFLLKFSHSQQSSVRKCTLFSEMLQYSCEEF